MDGWTDGWMDGWTDGWMDGWMEGWMDGTPRPWDPPPPGSHRTQILPLQGFPLALLGVHKRVLSDGLHEQLLRGTTRRVARRERNGTERNGTERTARPGPAPLLTAARASTNTASWLARLTSGSAFTNAFTRDNGSRAARAAPAHGAAPPPSSAATAAVSAAAAAAAAIPRRARAVPPGGAPPRRDPPRRRGALSRKPQHGAPPSVVPPMRSSRLLAPPTWLCALLVTPNSVPHIWPSVLTVPQTQLPALPVSRS